MATRSSISIVDSGGPATLSIYCHWDGYYATNGVGWFLYHHYNSLEAAASLISMGNASSIGETLEKCTFYIRDRGDTEAESGAREYGNLREALREEGQEYNYVWKDRQWWVGGMADELTPLKLLIEDETRKLQEDLTN